jgi:metal-responsive CopG/Arc/MetJ family transcriptional regulator
MRTRQHRISIFLDDEEMQRVYNAVAKEKMIPSRLVRKALMSYLDKFEADEENFEKYGTEDVEESKEVVFCDH